MNRNWIAVACARHVGRGRAGGFMQICHGKGGPLRRLNAGDGIVYYSPTVSLTGKDRLQAFTGIGLVKDDRTYQVDMGGGFHPFRRDVNYVDAIEASIVPLLDTLELTRGKQNWGYPFRLGLVEITARDFALIAAAMGVGRDEECRIAVASIPAFLYADRKAEAGS
jgi:EVE domain